MKAQQTKKLMALGTLLLSAIGLVVLATNTASAQSVADAARAARKNKADSAPTTHRFDNDNLPTDSGISVVGPSAPSDAQPQAQTKPPVDANAAAAERQKAADDWKDKLDKQKEKIESLNHELDLDQRELRLRAAAAYSDPAVRGRNAADWDKQDAQYKSDIESKQKALDAARQQLDELQEQARKAGIKDKDKDNDKDKDADDNKK